MMKNSRWIAAAPVLLVLAGVFYFSSQNYGDQDIRPWLSGNAIDERLIGWLHAIRFQYNGEEISVTSMGAYNVAEFIIRKLAHVVLYAGLGFTLLFAIWVLLPWRKALMIGFTLLLSFCFSLFDEYNQQFSAQRTSSLADVGIDMVGATLGIVCFLFLYMLHEQRKERLRKRPSRKLRTARMFHNRIDT